MLGVSALVKETRATDTRTGRPYLQVNNVGVAYTRARKTVQAIHAVSFDVQRGEFVTTVGTSGCGKSTLLHAIGGLVALDSGTIWCNGQPVTGPGPERVVVFQEFSLFKWRTALENVEYALECRRVPKTGRKEQAAFFLEKVGLTDFRDAFPFQLSGGMKQRVAIARALAYDAEVLLMDEPFGALDAQTRITMQEMLLQIWDELHKTVIFITHDIDEAVFLSDRILVMTARPGTIKSEVPVIAPRPRPSEFLLSREFLVAKSEVFHQVREEGRLLPGRAVAGSGVE